MGYDSRTPATSLAVADPLAGGAAGPGQPAAAVRGAPVLPRLSKIAYGGDYNPEQWPEQVWPEDVRLMRQAGVNLVNIGIFSWALLEPSEGHYDFGWLDRILDLLHGGGIAVDLATPTAAPPAWFALRHPDSRLVSREGHVLGGGGRQSFCPSSPAYREASARITEQLALRYAGHPALALWHCHNEYGGVNAACYCPTSAEAFRIWLREQYGDLGKLNEAWGTTFWGQRYGEWAQIEPPRLAPTVVNPAQQLDFLRFSSDAHLACFTTERDILHRLSPGVPVTTNFMIMNCKTMDYWRWAGEVDVVSNDHYLQAEQPDNHIELAMAADLTRSVAHGRPWLLMEHSTSAVNWQPRNIAKRPGEMRRNSLAHVARGADATLFFQWRASRFGAEKFHSAMLPHGGTNTRIFQDVARLGAQLAGLDELVGSRVAADVGVVWDWQSWWALELEWRPSIDLGYSERLSAFYHRLWRDHLTVGFVHPEGELHRYPLVLVPSLYLTTPAAAENLSAYVAGGGTLLVSYFSGIVDATDTMHPGGQPGALRELLGLSVEEFLPLRAGETIRLEEGQTADVWAEHVVTEGAETVLRYVDGPAAGGPAVTRHAVGQGTAWYVSTRLSGADLGSVLQRAYSDATLRRPDLPEGIEVVRRVSDSATYLIAINHTTEDATIPAAGLDLLTHTPHAAPTLIPAGDTRILRLPS
jgi:beta-galactosidase